MAKLIDRALEAISMDAGGATVSDVSRALNHSLDKTGAMLSYGKSQGLVALDDGRWKLTRDGQARLDKLATGEQPKRRSNKRTKRAEQQSARSAPSSKAHAVVVRQNGDRGSAVWALGAGLLENALGTWELFRSVLEDQLEESTPMIQAALDAHGKALELLQTGYRVAT